MIMAQWDVLLVAIVASVACVLPGVFLVLRGNALMSDAISHSVLLGIVTMFLWVHDLHSPLLFVGAVASGLLTVFLVEVIVGSKKVNMDAAIGLVFPLFFSIGVILINVFARHVHLDSDMVLMGEIGLAHIDRFEAFGLDLGPRAMWVLGGVGSLNLLFIGVFYKILKVMIFDRALATTLGLMPVLFHYILMGLVSVTAVAAFDVVGSILVVALMIAPAATAVLVFKRLWSVLVGSVGVGILCSVLGYGLAMWVDASVPGAIATMNGVVLMIVFLLAPQTGVLARLLTRNQQKVSFALNMVLVQCYDHEGTEHESQENTVSNLVDHMDWAGRFAERVVRQGVQKRKLTRKGNDLALTPLGRESVRDLLQMS